MKAREVAVILATGGMGLVRAAYSAGKPAYGVGPGNAPRYIERCADVAKAVRDIITGKTFDNGLLCSSENSVVVDAAVVEEVKRRVRRRTAATSCRDARSRRWRKVAGHARSGCRTPRSSGKPATYIAEQAGSGTCGHARPHRRAARCRARLPVVDREALSGALLLRREPTGRRAASAVRRSSATEVSCRRCCRAGLFARRSFPEAAYTDGRSGHLLLGSNMMAKPNYKRREMEG